jgi:hypothetical protein
MGKASRNKRTGSARDRIAAQREAARRREIRNRVFLSSGAIVVIIAIVLTFVLLKINKPKDKPAAKLQGTALSASIVDAVTNVPTATLDAVGAGQTYSKPIIPVTGTALTSNGKPEVLYIGAEFCPFCATERWAMTVALSRFGTFTGLRFIHSDPTDVFPNTPTLTYYNATYTSKYITFVPVETETVSKATLQTPTAAQDALIDKYDAPPYVTGEAGAIPFVDFGNKYIISGASYDPQVLQGQSWTSVAAALSDPSSSIAKGADGAANLITATICKLTNNQPGTACTSVVQGLEKSL